MQTITAHAGTLDSPSSSFVSSLSHSPHILDGTKRLKIKEFTSWSICFAVVAGLTGAMKWMALAITMEAVTSGLFYLSMAALLYFIFRIILISSSSEQHHRETMHQIN